MISTTTPPPTHLSILPQCILALQRTSPQVNVEPLSVTETLEVAEARHPGLPSPALKRLLHTIQAARGNAGGERGGFGCRGFASRSSAGGREPGVRDFLKLCARVDALGVFDGVPEMMVEEEEVGVDNVAEDDGWFCSEAQALPVVVESLEVFAGHLTTKVRSQLQYCSRGVYGFCDHDGMRLLCFIVEIEYCCRAHP